jgi:hypothetical protein
MSTGSPPIDPPEGAYDPELPFLEALEREVRRNALRAARRHEARARHGAGMGMGSTGELAPSSTVSRTRDVPHDGGRPLRGASRIARRSLILVVLLCLIGASAYGAREVFSGGGPNLTVARQGPSALLATGHSGADSWWLRSYKREGDLCRVLVVSGSSESSRCAPAPGPRSVSSTSMVSPSRRYVFGMAGGDVARVSVRVGGSTLVVPTHAPNSARARAAALGSGVRWFLAILDRPSGNSNPPALVRGLDARGHALGAASVSCVESAEPQQCP